jgi:hypothetical protein
MSGLRVFSLLLFISLSIISSAHALEVPSGVDAVYVKGVIPTSPPARTPRTAIDFQMTVIRTGLLAVGVLIFAWRPAGKRGQPNRATRAKSLLLVLLAIAAFASYYQFFRFSHIRGFATSDNFHYYLGSKYFSELGYFGLYECSLYSLTERGRPPVRGAGAQVRNLRNMKTEPANVITQMGEDCPERFSKDRWVSFGDDVEFFSTKWPKYLGNATFLDHGYHPSPAWTLAGGSVSNISDLGDSYSAYILSRLDRFLIGGLLLALYWAFGLETAALVALFWGTGLLWRYTWVGDAFLRHLWWLSAMIGVIALKRGFNASAGSALTLSTLFRIFPGAMGLGYLSHALRTSLRRKRILPGYYAFTAGAVTTFLIVVGLTAWSSGQGLSVYQDFFLKLREFATAPISNDIGLGVATQWIFPTSSTTSGLLYFTGVCAFLVLFWRAVGRIEDWEAAAAGTLLIPIFTNPTNYYFSFFAIAALTAARRPRIGLIVLITGLLWNVNGLLLYQKHSEFYWASIIAVASCFAIMTELAKSNEEPEVSIRPD